MCDRWTLVEAIYWYADHWHGGQSSYTYALFCRAGRIFRPGPCARFESADPEVRRVYGDLVRKHEGPSVAYERLHRRRPDLFPAWPGARNIRSLRPYHSFVQSLGFDPSILEKVAP